MDTENIFENEPNNSDDIDGIRYSIGDIVITNHIVKIGDALYPVSAISSLRLSQEEQTNSVLRRLAQLSFSIILFLIAVSIFNILTRALAEHSQPSLTLAAMGIGIAVCAFLGLALLRGARRRKTDTVLTLGVNSGERHVIRNAMLEPIAAAIEQAIAARWR